MSIPKPSLAYRAKRDPALLKRALADPGLRSKLPSSMLTVAQRRARALNQQNAALGDINTPLSGSNLTGAAQRITEGAYAPAYADLQRQSDLTNARETQSSQRAQSIYQQLGAYLQHALGAQQAAGQQSLANVGQINSQAQAAQQAAAQQVQAQQAADARVRGEGLDGGGNDAAAARAAEYGGLVAAQGGTRAGLANADAAAANALLAGITGATAQQGSEVQSNIRNAATQALQDIASKRAGIDQQKAGTFADTVTKLRQSAIDQNIAQQGLGLKAASATADAAAKEQQVNKYGYTNAQWSKMSVKDRRSVIAADKPKKGRPAGDLNGDGKVDAKDVKIRYDITHPGGAKKDGKRPRTGPGSLTTQQENGVWSKLDKARATLSKSTKNGVPIGPDGKPLGSDQAILDALQAGGLSRDEAYVALSMYRHKGALSPEAVKRAHNLGLHAGHRPRLTSTTVKVGSGVGSLGSKVGSLLG